jgi:hypothetical protein
VRSRLSLELRSYEHDFRCGARGGRLHRLVGQASVLLLGLGSWQRYERRRLLLAGNQLYSGSAAHRARLQPAPDQTAVAASNAWTDSFQNIKCYDNLKVQAILSEINGWDHSGTFRRPVPKLFGMNFQVVSVGQKLIEKSLTPTVTGGYLDNEGRPTPALFGEITFADASIGRMVSLLKARGLYNSTLIVISAKHGQSPIDSARYLGISIVPEDPTKTSPITTSPADCSSSEILGQWSG